MPPKHHPPHKHHHKHPGTHHRIPLPPELASRLEQGLAPLVPDPRERAFALRCVLEEGPAHHRGANAALLLLLLEATRKAGGPWPSQETGKRPRMHLPPHLMEDNPDTSYPVSLPERALRRVTGDDAVTQELVGALLDGPPQHSVANALMVALLEGLIMKEGGA